MTRTRMYLETMERVLGSADKIIIDSKSGQGVVPFLPLDTNGKSAKKRATDPSWPRRGVSRRQTAPLR